MYTPEHFAQTDEAAITALVAENPLACVVAQTFTGLLVNHLPLLAEGVDFIGHIALANDMHRRIEPDMPVVAVFSAAQGYVSPNWYPSKADHHKVVPTWNYDVVHVHGALIFSHDNRDKRRAVSLLTASHEKRVNGENAWRMGDAPPDFLQGMIDNIVALRLAVSRIEAKSKLSQNRDMVDRLGAQAGVEASGNGALAAAMAATLPK